VGLIKKKLQTNLSSHPPTALLFPLPLSPA
jgi:hypothetical protein